MIKTKTVAGGIQSNRKVGLFALGLVMLLLVSQYRTQLRISKAFLDESTVAVAADEANTASVEQRILNKQNGTTADLKTPSKATNSQGNNLALGDSISASSTRPPATKTHKISGNGSGEYQIASTSGNMSTTAIQATSKVLLVTYVFGEASVQKRPFRMFIESARYAGFDFMLVGDTKPAFALPPNVHYYPVTWEQLITRVYDRVFNMTLPKRCRLLNAQRYKVCDYKPLTAFLYPELVQNFEWWGHVDNDVIMGNLTHFFPDDMLQNHDIISGSEEHKTWGPFQLYRNIPVINTLFQKIQKEKPMEALFLDNVYHFFDEWNNMVRRGSKYSMTGLVRQYAGSLGLRHGSPPQKTVMWDKGECRYAYGKGNTPPRCAECVFQKGKLRFLNEHLGPSNRLLREDRDVYMCHYQGSKKYSLTPSLDNDKKFQDLIEAGEFRVSYNEGFRYFNLTTEEK